MSSPFDRVQTTTAASSGVAMTLAHAFTAPVQPGSALLVVVMAAVTPFGVTVSDDRGNAYTQIAQFGPGSTPAQMMSVWRCAAAFSGVTTVTITTSVAAAFVAHYLELVGPLGLPVETDEASGTVSTGYREDRNYPSSDPYMALVLGLAVGASNLTLWGTAITEQNQPPGALVTTFDPPPPIGLLYTIWAEHSGPTGAVDTTGATLLVIGIPYSNVGTPTLVITDSKGNLWTPLTAYGAPGTVRMRLYYCLNGTVGMGHTFSVSGIDAPIIIFSFTNVVAYQTENGAGATGTPAPPLATGSVTPAADGALILTALAANDAASYATNTIVPDLFPLTTGITGDVQGAIGWYIQPTAAAINPAWSWTGSRTDVAVTTAVFLPVNVTVPTTYRTKIAHPATVAP